jgi:hypothetical protein
MFIQIFHTTKPVDKKMFKKTAITASICHMEKTKFYVVLHKFIALSQNNGKNLGAN